MDGENGMALMTTLIAIIATVIFGLVGFIFGRFEKRLDSHSSRIKEGEKSQQEIVTNYVSRFEEVKDLISGMQIEMHKTMSAMTLENQQAHADLTDMFNFLRTKINEISARNN